MSATLDPAVVEQFRADAMACAGGSGDLAGPIGLAVSGGADSMAMLALADAAWPGRVEAATVDHRLRPAAADEARMVAEWCAARGVRHAILTVESPPTGSGIQAVARALRYRLLDKWARDRGLSAILTAHHADDQAETLLMRLARGSGLAGLRGIPAAQRRAGAVPVLRPLLGWRRPHLRALVAAAAIPFVDDPSNDDDRYERVRVRAVLAREPWLDPDRLARSAAALAEVDAELAAFTDWLWEQRRRMDEDGAGLCIDMAGLPRELRRRLVRRAITEVRAAAAIDRPAFDAATRVEALLDALQAGTPANQGGVLVTPRGVMWRFRVEPSRRSA